jgi:hypothetical protein
MTAYNREVVRRPCASFACLRYPSRLCPVQPRFYVTMARRHRHAAAMAGTGKPPSGDAEAQDKLGDLYSWPRRPAIGRLRSRVSQGRRAR